jgi:hypothetical protein
MNKIALISCVKTKLSKQSQAQYLYVSPLFKKTKSIVEWKYDSWFILSAKYGLVEPTTEIEPYELTVKTMDIDQRGAWARSIVEQLVRRFPDGGEVSIFAGQTYAGAICAQLCHAGFSVLLPLAGLSMGMRLRKLNEMIAKKEDSPIERLYSMLNVLMEGGATEEFGNMTGKTKLPQKGIYFFFEPGEFRAGSSAPRIVRIGTHGVSQGSKSTLWNRLKSHQGMELGGNHRSSIFRLHVGAALLNKNVLEHPTWGIGMSASAEVREAEREMESLVSQYMRTLRVAWVGVEDESSSQSDRAIIENNLIGLISNGFAPFDAPSPSWLGSSSPTIQIQKSGLWNIRGTKSEFQSGSLDLLNHHIDGTLGKIPVSNQSLARLYINSNQPQQNLSFE